MRERGPSAYLAAALAAVAASCAPDMSDDYDGWRPPDVPADDGGDFVEAEGDVEDVLPDDYEDEGPEEAVDDGAEVPCGPALEGLPCDDGDACTVGDVCRSGFCSGAPRDCGDLNGCTDDGCRPTSGVCTHTPNSEPCDDGDACTVGDACGAGACRPGPTRDCSGLTDGCNAGTCNALTGACFALPVPDGRSCDDGDPCSLGDVCRFGVCTGGGRRDCSSSGDACNTGRCDGGTGECYADPLPDGTGCNDGVACTTRDRCRSGACAGDRPDMDGDLYYAVGCLGGDDCDDTRWEINPGAPEGPIGRATCFDGIDNDCDGSTDRGAADCGVGIDWANLDTPTTASTNVGSPTVLIRGRVYEPGGTEAAGAMAGLSAEIGYGPRVTDPTDNPSWTWFRADYFGQGGPGGAHDVFAGALTPSSAGTFSYAYRYSTDGRATWLYADINGNGASPPSDGIQLDQLGTLSAIVNDHLLLTEVVALPWNAEFVEIYNPTGSSVALSACYLYDAADSGTTWRYWDLPAGSGSTRAFDFVSRFPAGASIGPGARVVVSLTSAQNHGTAYGGTPDYEMCPGATDSAVPNMVAAFPGSIGCAAGTAGQLNNSVETVVLFRWDGASDLVADVDVVQWKGPGSTTDEAVDKTGISRDGPDPGTTTSAYRADTSVGSQHFITEAPHLTGGSFARTDLGEASEVRASGNGITGHDETSENFSTTWAAVAAATPGR